MTTEGAFALALLDRPGMIRRAGMTGQPCGIDWAGALALAAPGYDRGLLNACLSAVDNGLVIGAARIAD